MPKQKTYLAVDMGASSGRHIAGHFDGKTLTLEEIYRFENGPVDIAGTLFWNLPGLWSSVLKGIQEAAARFGDGIISIGADTWGVDFALLGKNDTLLSNPVCYRDARTDGIMEKAFQTVSREDIFQQTGLQFMQFNTLYQLIAMKQMRNPLLDAAESFLMIPDFFHFLLSGEKSNEFTNATTTQFFNPVKNEWAADLLQRFGLPNSILRPVSPPGTVLGNLRRKIADAAGLTDTKVVLPGSHDTASAVMSVPATSKTGQTDWAYISLGTWALMGIESPKPVINETVSEFNFTNEGGVGGTMRILKNICGLWLIQECRRTWNQQGHTGRTGLPLDWEDLNWMTQAAKPLLSFINPDAREFLGPTDMPKAVADFCAKTKQPIPQNEGAILRCALDSIALKFRRTLEMCEKISGTKIETLHIVGGGTKNLQLCQATADACNRRLITGPIEATGIGNIMMQAVAAGDVSGIEEARQVIRNSFEVAEFLPNPNITAAWDDAYEKFIKLNL
ncbi:L-fuculose kinase [Planctomycetales bacterium]|nr:L-fuculose kinase [Planctomycetales bacterium]GHT34630.1 L-fuculose kinase [Planctomycetales bacterium]